MTDTRELGNIALCQQIAMILEAHKIEGELTENQVAKLNRLTDELDARTRRARQCEGDLDD